jgi:hypothetical protein
MSNWIKYLVALSVVLGASSNVFANLRDFKMTGAGTDDQWSTLANWEEGAETSLLENFEQPPKECSPGVFWYWLSGQVTSEGIDADLEAMKAAGIRNVMLFNVAEVRMQPSSALETVRVLSPKWRALMKQALIKADKLGISVNLYNSMEGWSSTGGPGITPEQAMQRITWSELKLEGGKPFKGKLPTPRIGFDTYREIAVIAFPTPESEKHEPVPIITSDVPGFDPSRLSKDPIPSIGFSNYYDSRQSRPDTALLRSTVRKNKDEKWIWYPEAGASAGKVVEAPVATRYFRRTFTLGDSAIKEASLSVTADNARRVWVNGNELSDAHSSSWRNLSTSDMKPFLKAGKNVIAVEAKNLSQPGPAGLLLIASIIPEAGETLNIVSDGQWKSSDRAGDSWREVSFSDADWKPALETIANGGGPWGPMLDENRHITLTYEKPFAARSFRLYPAFRTPWIHGSVLAKGELQRSDDGKKWELVKKLTLHSYNPLDVNFSAKPARYWRVVLSGERDLPLDELKLSESYRIENWTLKSFFSFRHLSSVSKLEHYETPAPASDIIKKESIIDITSKMNADGELNWDVPPGSWTVLRFGYTPTGSEVRPAGFGGEGLENDKFSKASLDAHWAQQIQPWLDDPETRDLFDALHIESYEAGSQNWTAKMPEEFRMRKGYDIISYLPVMIGRVVGSDLESERFLWDFRSTACDLVRENYFEYFRDLCHQAGKKFTAEAYGSDGTLNVVECAKTADVTMCSGGGYYYTKMASSPAHLYGKKVVSAEAFTATRASGSDWTYAFNELKPWADNFLASGINHFTYHVYTAQPFDDSVRPGLTLARWGTHFHRTQTWWKEMPAFSTYLARSSYLLQQGRFVGDVLFIYGEGSAKNYTFQNAHPEEAYKLPRGYDGDFGDLDVLLNRITVKDGLLATPDGIAYKILVVPNESNVMTPQLVKRIGELIAAGATVMAPKPLRSPSLSKQPLADAYITRMAEEIWGHCDGVQAKEHSYGKGKVVWGKTLAQILDDENIEPAVISSFFSGVHQPDSGTQTTQWKWIQRRLPTGDLFFVMNPTGEAAEIDCSFRTDGTSPQWFDAVTGKAWMLPEFEKADGRVNLKLEFAPRQSGFVFFSNQPKPASGKNNPKLETVLTIDGAWNVGFDPNWGPFDSAQGRRPGEFVFEKLEDWSKSVNEAIKYYSGRATYKKTFTMPDVAKGETYFLDLGKVKNMANVTLNGKKLGTVWCAPWHIQIQPEKGRNVLEIEVVNLWVNRLIGDIKFDGSVERHSNGLAKRLPAWLDGSVLRPENRYTFSLYNPWKPDSPLQPSGLLGPVTIRHVVPPLGCK